MLDVKSDEARKTVKSVCEYVVWLKSIHHIYLELFENDEAEDLMQKTAAVFFRDVNKVIVDYLLLSIARITDPPRTGQHENFTVGNLRETIDWPENIRQRLTELNQRLEAFKRHIAPARNKLIAHLDKPSFLGDLALGEFPAGQDREVMKALEEMCNVMHKASFGEIFGSIGVGVWGDVSDLKKSLTRSIAFEKLWKEAKGEELFKLHQLLKS